MTPPRTPQNPFRHACVVPGCGAPVAVRGRCAGHAATQDRLRGLAADRAHVRLYQSARWRRLRKTILTERPWCECPDCRGQIFDSLATVIHHVEPHGGDETKFYDPANLQALAKRCHDRLTGRARQGGGPNYV